MVVTPTLTDVTKPVEGFTVATPGLLLLHVPPGVAQLSADVLPRHMVVLPSIGASGFTVIVNVE